jgi:hypothetical protein
MFIEKAYRGFIKRWRLFSAGILLIAFCCILFIPLPPSGKFWIRGASFESNGYFKCNGGHFTEEYSEDGEVFSYGTYTRTNGVWLLTYPQGEKNEEQTFIIDSTLTRLRITSPQNENYAEAYPRLWWGIVLYCDFMPKWMIPDIYSDASFGLFYVCWIVAAIALVWLLRFIWFLWFLLNKSALNKAKGLCLLWGGVLCGYLVMLLIILLTTESLYGFMEIFLGLSPFLSALVAGFWIQCRMRRRLMRPVSAGMETGIKLHGKEIIHSRILCYLWFLQICLYVAIFMIKGIMGEWRDGSELILGICILISLVGLWIQWRLLRDMKHLTHQGIINQTAKTDSQDGREKGKWKLMNKLWKKILLFLLLFIALVLVEKAIQLNRYTLGMTLADAIELTNGEYDVSRYLLDIEGYTQEELEKKELYYLINLRTGVYLDFNYYGKLIKKRVYPTSILGINITPVIVKIGTYFEK